LAISASGHTTSSLIFDVEVLGWRVVEQGSAVTHQLIKFVTHCQPGHKARRQAIDVFNELEHFLMIAATRDSVHDAALAVCSKLGP
jgi:hypothetical protein